MNNSRQSDLIKATGAVGVIGAGSIGSYVIPLLVKAGFQVVVWDDDDVYEDNVAGGVFDARMISDGKRVPTPKVKSVASIVKLMTGVDKVIGHYQKFLPETTVDVRVLLSGVDTMETRRLIWKWIESNPGQVDLYVDGRIGGHGASVWTVQPSVLGETERYAPALEWVAADLPCGQKATGYICSWTAAMMMNSVVRFFNGEQVPQYSALNADCGYTAIY